MAQLIDKRLTAELVGGQVVISGNKDRIKLLQGSGEHIFRFELIDNTGGANVQFNGFGAQRGEICPSQPVNNVKKQIYGEEWAAGTSASFKDKNSNDGVLSFCYTWFFSCNVPNQEPIFDPIVDNGGR